VRKGIAAVEEAGAKGGGFSGRLGYFGLDEGETVVIRFLTDLDKDVVTLDFWEFIVDNKNKPQNFAVAADVYENKDQTDYVIEYGGRQRDFTTKELIDPSPKTRSVGLAVECEEYAEEQSNGRPKIKHRPMLVDIETKNGVKKGYRFLIVKQAYKNFWGPLKSHWEENNGTICDRYYKVKRVGKGSDTTYTFMEKEEDPTWEDDPDAAYEALQAQFGYGVDVDKDDDNRFQFVPQTVEEWARDSCSEDRVKYFLGDEEERDAQNNKSKGDDAEDENEAAAPPSSGGGGLQARMSRHKVSSAE
jgi:hypothetical protein